MEQNNLGNQDNPLVVDAIIDDHSWYKVVDGPYHLVVRALSSVSSLMKLSKSTVTVKLTNDAALRELNHRFRDKDEATNVLSFPHEESYPVEETEPLYLGDIAISHQRIVEESLLHEREVEKHFTHILIHGFLHLLGYDHQEKKDREIMEKKEIELLEDFDISNPYLYSNSDR